MVPQHELRLDWLLGADLAHLLGIREQLGQACCSQAPEARLPHEKAARATDPFKSPVTYFTFIGHLNTLVLNMNLLRKR